MLICYFMKYTLKNACLSYEKNISRVSSLLHRCKNASLWEPSSMPQRVLNHLASSWSRRADRQRAANREWLWHLDHILPRDFIAFRHLYQRPSIPLNSSYFLLCLRLWKRIALNISAEHRMVFSFEISASSCIVSSSGYQP